jgi:3',5'-cyclic AMP phosphodiesterase CpdA
MASFPTVDRRRFLELLAASGAACLGLDGALLAAEDAAYEKPIFSFGVIADVQYNDAEPKMNRYYREAVKRLDACVRHLNALKPDFTIQLGDLIEGSFDNYDAVLPVLGKLAMPVYPVLGNHDADIEPENRERVLAKLGLDRLGDKKGYYDFARAGWHFVVLNGNDVSLFAHAPGTAPRKAAERLLNGLKKKGAQNAQTWNGGVGKVQIQWLNRTLARASAAREPTIVFCHYPVYPPTAHTLWNDAEVIHVLEAQPSVIAFLCGHNHEGNYARKNGIHYLTFRGMVETRETAYALVEAYPNRLRVTGFGRETDRVLAM